MWINLLILYLIYGAIQTLYMLILKYKAQNISTLDFVLTTMCFAPIYTGFIILYEARTR